MARLTAKKPAPAKPATVKMECDGKTADVHPSEVENMLAAGWRKVGK